MSKFMERKTHLKDKKAPCHEAGRLARMRTGCSTERADQNLDYCSVLVLAWCFREVIKM